MAYKIFIIFFLEYFVYITQQNDNCGIALEKLNKFFEKVSGSDEALPHKILDVFREQFAIRGFNAVSFTLVAKISGIDVETLKKHFKNKEQVLGEVFLEEHKLYYDELYFEIQSESEWMDILRKYFYFSIDYFAAKPLARNIIFSVPFKYIGAESSAMWERYRKRAEDHKLPVKQIVENIVEEQLFPGNSGMFWEVIENFLIGQMITLDNKSKVDFLKKKSDFFLNLVL